MPMAPRPMRAMCWSAWGRGAGGGGGAEERDGVVVDIAINDVNGTGGYGLFKFLRDGGGAVGLSSRYRQASTYTQVCRACRSEVNWSCACRFRWSEVLDSVLFLLNLFFRRFLSSLCRRP